MSNWKTLLLGVPVALAAIAGFLGNLEKILDVGRKTYSLVVPSIEIAPGVIGSDTDALAAEFTFLNTERFPSMESEFNAQ